MKKRDLILITLLNLVLVIGLLFAGFFTYRQVRTLGTAESQLAELLSKKQGLAELKNSLISRREEQLKIDSSVIAEENVAQLLEQLEVIAKHLNLELNVVSVSAGDTLDVNLNVRGSYAAVMRYVELLGSTKYLISFNRVSLQAAVPGSSWSGNIVFKILSFKKK